MDTIKTLAVDIDGQAIEVGTAEPYEEMIFVRDLFHFDRVMTPEEFTEFINNGSWYIKEARQ
jgi:hypothetical protein